MEPETSPIWKKDKNIFLTFFLLNFGGVKLKTPTMWKLQIHQSLRMEKHTMNTIPPIIKEANLRGRVIISIVDFLF